MQKQKSRRFAIGVDFGTNSVRGVVVDLQDGAELATSIHDYADGEQGVLLDPRDPNLARQNPADYIAGAVAVISGAVREASRHKGFAPGLVAGIGVDTTGSTPLPVDAEGMPLALKPAFRRNLAAHAWLWKDHTAAAEAAEITALASRAREGYLEKCGGVYSSEWYWAKILKCKRVAPEVFRAAASWVELADFIPAVLTGTTRPADLRRGICAAGHKALYHEDWGGLPRKAFLQKLDPELVRLLEHYRTPACSSDQQAGGLTAEYAARTGLPAGVPVAVGAFDAHMGAVGAGVKPGTLVKIIGTSTCDITVWPEDQPLGHIPGLCGIVPGSVLPGMYGLEAGQSAVGDIFHWHVRQLTGQAGDRASDSHAALTAAAARLAPGESGLLALDWNNGNRTVLVDPLLTGLLVGQTLYTSSAEIYRALIEATAFGALTIIRRMEEHGVAIREVVNCGGIAEKNPLLMQIYADVCNRPMKVSRSGQTCALGAAIFGAVAGGAFRSVAAAQRQMTGTRSEVYKPDRRAARVYARLYGLYRQLHDAFGVRGTRSDLSGVMKELIAIRDEVRREKP